MTDKGIILIAAGGTGGHLYPGIALGRELRKRGFEPVFAVRVNDPGRDILAHEGLSFIELPMTGMPRSLSPKIFSFLSGLLKSLSICRSFIRERQPVIVAGMGSYLSVPVIAAGKLAGIPAAIHEQNYVPGIANRLLARIADSVAVSFEESRRYFPSKRTVLTGNPVRREIFTVQREGLLQRYGLMPGRLTILVFGGSQGAAGINRAALGALNLLVPVKDKLQFIHITGTNEAGTAEQEYLRHGFTAAVLPYLHAMGEAYALADLIVCRAGATTVAELNILRKPALLIPYPAATDNHQEFNARSLVKIGLAAMVLEKDLTPESFAREIASFTLSPHPRQTTAALPPVFPQEVLADQLLALLK